MPTHSHADHHHHKRLRKKDTPFLDKLIFFAALASPAMTFPQVFKIWIEQDASGVSIISWAAYTVTAFIWLAYGVAHKDKAIIISNGLWLTLDPLIVIGALIYG